ncbi:4-hydroxy-2-oxo-heptane-1,7-dioate aldolase, partial [Burkholderia pseudomallei]|nr:4-hydroxy-2-oxo-heptane-1,7-dioate aldolase [Burkholderia pseudomallei]
FVAVGVDTTLLARGAERLAAQFKPAAGGAARAGDGPY